MRLKEKIKEYFRIGFLPKRRDAIKVELIKENVKFDIRNDVFTETIMNALKNSKSYNEKIIFKDSPIDVIYVDDNKNYITLLNIHFKVVSRYLNRYDSLIYDINNSEYIIAVYSNYINVMKNKVS